MNVIIAGAGPVGLMLACELRLHGVETLVLERLTEISEHSRAANLHPRSVDTFALRGIEIDAPQLPLQHFSGMRLLDLTKVRTPHPYGLLIPQPEVERLLEKRAVELGAEVRRGCTVTGLEQDEHGVTVTVDAAEEIRATWLVGCDGGRSTVRKLAGIGFPGTEPTVAAYVADLVIADPQAPPTGWLHGPAGLSLWPFTRPEGRTRIITTDYGRTHQDRDAPVTRAEFEDSLRRHLGDRAPRIVEATWLSRFSDASRQADRYRAGRVFLAGDAAHIHMPFGGQGMNTGLQDAVNLGWKLALAVQGRAEVLDTYEQERHPVAAAVLENTLQQVALGRTDEQTVRLRELFAQLMTVPEANRLLAEEVAGVSIRYGDQGFVTGPVALHDGRGLLTTADDEVRRAALPWSDRVNVARGERDRLVRPDGYVAWEPPSAEPVEAALTRWFGNPAAPRG
ncbi:FAD-dependent oxidoreductase [Nonomuraea sp. NPDC050536]|uniref:FAD-dependent oxidoreductase n=1 Tax=Nonomuraea sp. NPDC050536 TaxID=3364366 RepID=UPI0037CC6DD2